MKTDTIKVVREMVNNIEKDILDRRGLKSEWQQIDQDIIDEIKLKWEAIILRGLLKLRKKKAEAK